MSKKDYVKFAEMFREQKGKTDGEAVLADLIWGACQIFAEDNPNFDRMRFLKACHEGGKV